MIKRLRWPLATGIVIAAALTLTGVANAATVGLLEAETMTSVQGYGAFVVNDSSASGGKALKVDSNVTVRKTGVPLSASATSLTVRAHTDSGVSPAKMTVSVDGVALPQNSVGTASWSNFTHSGNWSAGTHTVRITFSNACCRNLYLDKVTFTGADAPPPQPGETSMQAYVTGYSFYDNTPPGSAEISHPQIHQVADGTGTYADPITVAVGHDLSSGSDVLDWPAGTRFYMPYLHRYFIVEDTCGDGPTPENGPCHTGYPAPATTWLDVWVDGSTDTEAQADACMSDITDVHTAIKNPASNYVVQSGPIAANGGCTQQFSETPQTQ